MLIGILRFAVEHGDEGWIVERIRFARFQALTHLNHQQLAIFLFQLQCLRQDGLVLRHPLSISRRHWTGVPYALSISPKVAFTASSHSMGFPVLIRILGTP